MFLLKVRPLECSSSWAFGGPVTPPFPPPITALSLGLTMTADVCYASWARHCSTHTESSKQPTYWLLLLASFTEN